MTYDYETLREYVNRCKWGWATSMIDVPHEYIVRGKCALSDEEFLYFVHAQRDLGVHERWGKYNFPYLYIDGYKYWTMGDTFENTIILNRQKVFNEFDFLEWPIPDLCSKAEQDMMVRTVATTYKDKKVFEAGIGNGVFVELAKPLPERYYGVDPSKKSVTQFRSKADGFYRRCSTMSFEQAINKWLSADSVVIALWGTASYFMHQYLRKLGESGIEHCLMFYREGYSPEEYKDMHHFEYTKNEIKSFFPKSNVYNHEKFITVSSRQLTWQQTTVTNELFPI